jgi:predicted ATP-grasp superfamily ATP-dependent carboligase
MVASAPAVSGSPLSTALVTDTHLRASLAGLRALALAGIEVLALGERRSAGGLWSRHVAGRAVSRGGPDDPEELWRAIERLAGAHGPLVVYPGQERTIDALLTREPPPGVRLPYPGIAGLQAIRDKARLAELADAAGLGSPATIAEASAAELRASGVRLPAVVKPVTPGATLATARPVATPDQLAAVLAGVPDAERLLVQERLPGALVALALVLDADGAVRARFQQAARRTWPADAGVSSVAVSVAPDEKLVARAAGLLNAAGYAGLAQLQFVAGPSGPALIDVNPRFYGSLPLAVACGVNLPAAWHELVSGAPPSSDGAGDYRVGVTYRWLEGDLLAAVYGSPGRLLERPPRPRVGAVWSAGDPLPSALLAADSAVSKIARRLPGRRHARSRRYVQVPYPWKAAVGVGAPGPAAFYAMLVGNALRSGRRTRHRLGAVWRFTAAHPPPAGLLAGSVRGLPRRARPDIDELLDRVEADWPALAERSARLPAEPPALTALALQRSAGLTVFVFGTGTEPLMVLKVTDADDARLAAEAAALREAAPAGVAPRELGRVGRAYAQEALAGEPLPLVRVEPEAADALRWSGPHQELAAGLTRLAETTAKRAFPEELRRPVERALERGPLSPSARRSLQAAWRDVSGLEAAVLRHHDIAAENCLFDGGRLVGIVDWEHAESRGTPAFDVLNTALSYMEFGVGLAGWSQEGVVTALERSWERSEFWIRARAAARESAAAAGVPESAFRPLEVVFFGSRVGDRAEPGRVDYATGLETVTRQLELVCAA